MAAEGEESFREGSRTPTGPSSVSARRSPSRGIVIHLTGTEGEWDSLEDDELVFPLDHGDNSVPKDTLLPAEDQRGCQVPPSPSSTGSLGLLRPGPSPSNPRPPFGLVKSMSTELEPKDSSTLGPRPFLSLVKSISTELSRSEPEVAQSKSDSRLNLHLLKQLTQSRTRTGTWTSGDSRTAPPSPSGEGQRGGFFKAELEDTRKKLSEAVQEPLSCMFSRILGEEGGGSPRHPGGGNPWNPGGSTGGGSPRHQAGSRQSSCRSLEGEGSVDMASSESPVRTARGADDEDPLVFDWPSVRQRGSCPVHGQRQRPVEETLDPDGDGIKAEVCGVGPIRRLPKSSAEAPPPISLFCVAVLSYGYLVLPLGPYVSGLALGVALGFLLGLLLIRVGSSGSAAVRQPPPTPLGDAGGAISGESNGLKGWMNEIEDYDPESCHPALTHSVFASLEGSSLRLDYPRSSISRRAAYDDKIQEVTFIKSRRVQLANSKVSLLPAALARKRVWNPKYPICIQLAAGDEEGAGPAENLEPGAESASCGPQVLYLFGRTGREKEEWFRLLQLASRTTEGEEDEPGPSRTSGRSGHPSQDLPVPRSRGPSSDEDNPSSPPAPGVPAAPPSATRGLPALDYHGYMARLLAADRPTPPFSAEPSPTVRADCTCDDITSPEAGSPAWVNALIGRIFWDFLREKHWADVVSRKIQKKLSKIRLPCFMNELTLTELDMGRALPQVLAASRPAVDRRGLWVELQLLYTGNLQMSLQTRFNLSKLGKEGQETAACAMETRRPSCRPVLSVLADSEEESSSAASSDEEEPLPSEPHCAAGEKGSAPGPEGTGGGKTGRKILRFVDKIAKSKCFQRAAENEFIKKKFEEMSNTPLLLSVEVQELAGTLVVNIPAPPTDRIWYSFRGPPKLDLHVCPKLGQRELSFCQVTEWIERKLQEEFQKVFVLPNMDDVFVPLMNSEMDRLSQASSERVHPEAGGTSTSSA